MTHSLCTDGLLHRLSALLDQTVLFKEEISTHSVRRAAHHVRGLFGMGKGGGGLVTMCAIKLNDASPRRH